MTSKMFSAPVVLFGLLLLLAAGFILLSAGTVVVQPASSQEVSAKWDALVKAIKADDQEEIEAIVEWLEAQGKLTAVEETTKRFICAWCGKDLGPTDTLENSHGICAECGKRFLEGE